MPNYQNGKIYMLESKEGGVRYYGSTVQTLKERLRQHKKQKGYITSQEVLKYDDCKIILVVNYPCNSRKELETKEREYIENNECVNKQIPTRKHREYYKKYYEEKKDEILQKHKEYREKNRDKITQKYKEYYDEKKDRIFEKIICPCGAESTKHHIRRHEKTIKHKEWEQLYNFIYS